MFYNYLKIAVRHLERHKLFSLITVGGLAVGLTVSLIAFLYIRHELSFNAFLPRADQIYTIQTTRISGDADSQFLGLPAPLSKNLSEIPEIQNFSQIAGGDFEQLIYENNEFRESGILPVDSTFLDVLQFQLLRGDRKTALDQPSSIVLTRSLAHKIFGETDPINRPVTLEGHDFQVTAVLADLPDNSTFDFTALVPRAASDQIHTQLMSVINTSWLAFLQTYLVLSEELDIATVENKLNALLTILQPEGQSYSYRLDLLNVQDIYFQADSETQFGQGGDIRTLYVFGTVGILVLLIAGLNFMNLSLARSAERTKEVGIRKVIGAVRTQLLKQHLGESLIIAFFAMLLAIVLVEIVVPYFNVLTSKSLDVTYLGKGTILHWYLLITIVIGVLSGGYPAFFLSRFQPVSVLTYRSGLPRETLIRRVLIGGQFTISIGLLICTIIILHQFHYIRTEDKGFHSEHIVQLPVGDIDMHPGKYQSLKSRLQNIPEVQQVTASGNSMGQRLPWTTLKLSSGEEILVQNHNVDYGFFRTYDINLIAGRSFKQEYPTDRASAFVVNQAMVKSLQLEDPLGKQISLPELNKEGRIIGVVDNYHVETLYEPIEPTVSYLLPAAFLSVISVRLHPEGIQSGLSSIETVWSDLFPGYTFNYTFVDETLRNIYAADARFRTIVIIFTSISIILATMGVFGLAAYSMFKQQKAIGIRKVLGASMARILLHLTQEFYLVVLAGLLIGSLLAYFSIQPWLNQFAYHITITPVVFLIAGLVMLFVVSLAVGVHAIKYSLTNPADTLRYE